MTKQLNTAMAHQFFLNTLRKQGYSQEDCEAISRGMTLSPFRGEMLHDKKQRDELIASWIELGRLQ